jgi:hypothetical protein
VGIEHVLSFNAEAHAPPVPAQRMIDRNQCDASWARQQEASQPAVPFQETWPKRSSFGRKHPAILPHDRSVVAGETGPSGLAVGSCHAYLAHSELLSSGKARKAFGGHRFQTRRKSS